MVIYTHQIFLEIVLRYSLLNCSWKLPLGWEMHLATSNNKTMFFFLLRSSLWSPHRATACNSWTTSRKRTTKKQERQGNYTKSSINLLVFGTKSKIPIPLNEEFCFKQGIYLEYGPLPVTVTTRIITSLVGDSWKSWFATVVGRGAKVDIIHPKKI